MGFYNVNPFSYGVYGSKTQNGISAYINMKGGVNKPNWACYSAIRSSYGNGVSNPYFFCHIAMGGFDEMLESIRIRLSHINLTLLSKNEFILVHKKGGSSSYSFWGESSPTAYLTDDLDFIDNDEYTELGSFMYPVFSAKFDKNYNDSALAQLPYYLGVTFRNASVGELRYVSPQIFSGNDNNEITCKFLKTFRDSSNKFATLLDWSTGKDNGHATADKKLTERDWLLIDNYEIVNKVCNDIDYPGQNEFFRRLVEEGRKLENHEQPEVQPALSPVRRAVKPKVE